MDIRQAIFKAADSIERHPTLFNFSSIEKPNHHCGTPGCAIGWIGYYTEGSARDPHDFFLKVMKRLGLRGLGAEFYHRMDSIDGSNFWRRRSDVCAATLRKYADKYHPAKKTLPVIHEGLPKSITDLFREVA